MAPNTSSSSPLAPIIDASTTIYNDIMVVWLIPAMMLGSASGNWTPNSFCQRLASKAVTDSITSLSIWRMPKSIRRISGGVA